MRFCCPVFNCAILVCVRVFRENIMKNLSVSLPHLGMLSVLMISHVQAEEQVTEEGLQLDKVVISAHSFDQGQDEMSQPASLLNGEDLIRQRSNNLGETLSTQVGIHNSSYGLAVGRPVIRGMSGARVKVLQGGIDSLDASTVSPDHGVNVDIHSANKIEVLRGPATIMYGSGAFGGVVNVVDERIPSGQSDVDFNTEIRTQYDSVNQGKTFALKNQGNAKQIYWQLSASHARSDEYALPPLAEHEEHHEDEAEEEHEEHASEDQLANSDVSYSNNITFGTSYVFDSGYFGIALSQSKSEYGLPGHVHHEEHEEEESEAEHEQHDSEGARIEMRQQRVDLDSRFNQPLQGIEAVKFRMGFNDYRHDEIEEGVVGTQFRRKGYEGRSEILLMPMANISQVAGVQFSQDTFEAVGVPETDSLMAGLFWLGKTQLVGWSVELAARMETSELSPDQVTNIDSSCELSPADYQDKRFDSPSFSMGLIRDLVLNANNETQWQLTASVTSAQRAPSTQELFSCGAHAATQTFDVGNPNLQAEQALNIELGLRKISGDLTANINLYQNRVDDFIYADNSGEEVNEFGKYLFTQEDARFQGGEFDLTYQALPGLIVTAMADAVRADNMPRIPADRFGLGFEISTVALFATQSDWMLFGQWQQVQKQNQVADNEEQSLGYDLLSLGMSYQTILANTEYRVDLKANNLLDEEVRQHTSFVREQAPQPGRNLSVGVRVTF